MVLHPDPVIHAQMFKQAGGLRTLAYRCSSSLQQTRGRDVERGLDEIGYKAKILKIAVARRSNRPSSVIDARACSVVSAHMKRFYRDLSRGSIAWAFSCRQFARPATARSGPSRVHHHRGHNHCAGTLRGTPDDRFRTGASRAAVCFVRGIGRAALLRWPQSAPPTVQHAPSRAYRNALRARVSQSGRSSTVCR